MVCWSRAAFIRASNTGRASIAVQHSIQTLASGCAAQGGHPSNKGVQIHLTTALHSVDSSPIGCFIVFKAVFHQVQITCQQRCSQLLAVQPQPSSAQHNTTQRSTAQHSTTRRGAATTQHSKAQLDTAKRITAQRSIPQHSTAWLSKVAPKARNSNSTAIFWTFCADCSSSDASLCSSFQTKPHTKNNTPVTVPNSQVYIAGQRLVTCRRDIECRLHFPPVLP